jgi:TolB protein
VIRRIIIFGGAALVIAALTAGLSQATTPGKDGRIAFQRFELHDAPFTARIMVTNSAGSGQHAITHPSEGTVDDQPDWAADGSRIVFERCRSACHIWTVHPNGQSLRRLSPPCPRGAHTGKRCPDDSFPAYSPDGRHIAFVRYRRRGGQLVMIADARLRHALSLGQGYEPGWSPDGKQLVFVRKPGAFQAVYLVNADGTNLHRITRWGLQGGKHPDWSPDGTHILFGSGGELDRGNLYSIRPDGTGLQQLTHFHGRTKVSVGSYSPDGSSIVFSTVVGAVNPPGATLTDVFVMTADGTDIRPVTRARNWDGSADWGPRG